MNSFVKKFSSVKNIFSLRLHYAFDSTSGILKITGWGERVDSHDTHSYIEYDEKDCNYSLKQVDFSQAEGIKRIGNHAFSHCLGLTSIDLPESITSISESAFFKCDNLEEIHCRSLTPPKIEPDPFFYLNIKRCYVPKGTIDTYKKANGWSYYAQQWDFIEE